MRENIDQIYEQVKATAMDGNVSSTRDVHNSFLLQSSLSNGTFTKETNTEKFSFMRNFVITMARRFQVLQGLQKPKQFAIN